MKSPLEILQPLGRALMLPIAVLPVAGLLLRLGQPDLLNIGFMAAAGDAIFSNLGLLFAIGVAVGLARENNGAAGLAGVVCFLIAVEGAKALLHVPAEVTAGLVQAHADLASAAYKAKALAKLSVPIGIVSGIIGGLFYNRFSGFKLPEYLAFFSGRRFVPIVSGLAGLAIAVLLGLGYDAINGGVDAASRAVVGSGEIGLVVFGFLNRILIVTGLHHILNNIAWFVVGDYHGATGDLRRFFAGDPSAGAFMSGFFPVMMFGLPAACLAMYHAAKPEKKKAVGGMLASLALTSFLTGVTEPIEFSFMFLAPALYAIHAILTGVSMALLDMLHVKLGFTFSAGLFDYVLNFGKASRPLWLIPIGLVYAGVYYGLFRLAIARFDLKTPGREDDEAAPIQAVTTGGGRGADFVQALGGATNLASVDACTTRLRLIVADQAAVSEAALKALGARGIVRPSDKALQVVLGPIADAVAGEIRAALGAPAPKVQPPVQAQSSQVASSAPSAQDEAKAKALLAALGGPGNLRQLSAGSSRLRLVLQKPAALDQAALANAGARGLVHITDTLVHVILGPDADAVGRAIQAKL
ncbi:PTS N-acetyl-D-glucosamine transporter [Caulobacter segnis]|uniref:PTS system, N-acetylglucosamine-specific IIBC subunit n=2 Tax=Caulobacter segnis TaxID=88688 RepID=D5VM57_CAUST|nr:N-acetylglucosamine-specific PTS transporter subunit IIBC [Caulobacter segnis]ADG11580.1 PTS system, N-acetylglucosamine-specific IIBC subunit [Caulobacter segnis ATCC 21756]ADG12158.1 PTS system, N-acetylglucosamine-specific IIBC subunit [Caulobacter segnis ATCC 21756]AVQ03234.1 PTS N-acetyl-D-glucosamine transporter [Caulobacter segnis]AVQ03760.1 PTS N-acetyl-D-glucosamine transporter [Caulobacter segnis]